ncbi:MAG TPA: efflux RND transporter periplasmic adaptor subunit [Tepidisphaeraceae bacterium]|nr:efflux RND transporter periplasmic adaptor subunit [Tepidisphaeraceae bacterium]
MAVISLTLSACDDKPATPGVGAASMPQRPPAPVQVAKAITKTVPIYIDEIGTCSPREFVQIRPQVAGKIMELHFTDGADIKKGQLLFTIDSRPYQAALDQAKASLAQAMASKSLATQQLENAQAAINAHAIAREELENRQNAVTIADAEIRVRQAAIETAQVNVDYCTITSPIDGRAGQRMIDVGNVVKANDDNPLLTIQRMDPIYADFITSERNLDEVRRQSDHGVLKTLVWSPQQSESQARQGELTFLDSTVQTGTGTIKLRATLPNKDRLFWPGEFVRIRLVLAEQPNAVLIPVVAQQVGQQGPFVYVAKPGPPSPDGKPSTIAELRPITLGQRQGDMIVVDKGLAAGEQVVTVGQMMIMPGGPVQIVPSTPPAMPTTSPTSQPASH